jgi:hypothetical protein
MSWRCLAARRRQSPVMLLGVLGTRTKASGRGFRCAPEPWVSRNNGALCTQPFMFGSSVFCLAGLSVTCANKINRGLCLPQDKLRRQASRHLVFDVRMAPLPYRVGHLLTSICTPRKQLVKYGPTTTLLHLQEVQRHAIVRVEAVSPRRLQSACGTVSALSYRQRGYTGSRGTRVSLKDTPSLIYTPDRAPKRMAEE